MVDPTKPFFVGGNGDAEVVYADAYAMITGHIPLYRTEGVNCRKVGDNLLLYAVNLPVERLFYEAFKPLIFPAFDQSRGVQWRVDGAFKAKLPLNKPEAGKNGNYLQDSLAAAWMADHTYSEIGRAHV